MTAEKEDTGQEAATRLEFGRAALIRDQIHTLKSGDFKRRAKPAPTPAPGKRGGGASRPRRKL